MEVLMDSSTRAWQAEGSGEGESSEGQTGRAMIGRNVSMEVKMMQEVISSTQLFQVYERHGHGHGHELQTCPMERRDCSVRSACNVSEWR